MGESARAATARAVDVRGGGRGRPHHLRDRWALPTTARRRHRRGHRRLGELYALYTHPTHQGHGAGTAARAALLSRLADQGFAAAALWVLLDNRPARRWYGARGWSADGVTSQWLGAGVALEEVRLVRRLDGSREWEIAQRLV